MNWKSLLCEERIRGYKRASSAGDLRSEFEKDYHRIIGSASFRRLQDKTQVFPLDRSDFVRTRLTHSLEVSSFCKSLGQNISAKILTEIKDPTFTGQSKADICDVLQCAGLLHDIGNPPFGHFGESAIRDWFRMHMDHLTFKDQPLTKLLNEQMLEDFYHFEGNAQALRLITKLHFLVDENGMNLTKGLLNTIIKYPVASHRICKKSGNIKEKKMGYFYADKEVFQTVTQSTGANNNRHPLTFILEAADDIAYRTADIEDAVKKGCLSYFDLCRELEDYQKSEQTGNYQRLMRRMKDNYQLAKEKGYVRPDLYAVQNWIVYAQGYLIQSATAGFTADYADIMAGNLHHDLLQGTDGELLAKALGDIAYHYAFQITPIVKLEIAAGKIFQFFLDHFIPAAIRFDTGQKQTIMEEKLMRLVSDNYKNTYFIYRQGKSDMEALYLRLLLITDFICGMTDTYAKSLYQELNGII